MIVIIFFAVAYIIGVIISSYFIGRVESRQASIHDRYAKILSTDKKPEKIHTGRYVIYANGGRWLFENWVIWKLYWIPNSVNKDIDNNNSGYYLEFQSTWLRDSLKLKICKRVMKNHPNLKSASA